MKIKIIAALITMILVIACEVPDRFQGLKWDVEINVPLMNRTYPLFDLESDENINIEDSLLIFTMETDVESDNAAPNLKLDSQSSETTTIYPVTEGINVTLPIAETGIDDEEIKVTYAHIVSGIINIELKDVSPDLEILNIVFKDVITPEGTPFETKIYDFEEELHSFEIAGSSIGEKDSDAVMDSLTFHVVSMHEDTEHELADLRIFFEEPIYFDYFEGYLTNQKIAIEEQEIMSDINYPRNITDAIKLEEAKLSLDIDNSFGFDAQLVGSLVGYNSVDNKKRILPVTPQDQAIFERSIVPGEHQNSRIVIDKPELVDFLNILPDRIIFEDIKLIIGNVDNSKGFATAANTAYGSLKLAAPSKLSFNEQTIVPDTVFTVAIDEDNQELIEEYPERVELFFTLENTLPVGASADIFMSSSPDTLHLFHSPPENIKTIVFPGNFIAAAAEGEPNVSEVSFAMNREDLELFLRDEIFFAIKISFRRTENMVVIRPQQYLNINGRLNIKLNIDV